MDTDGSDILSLPQTGRRVQELKYLHFAKQR